MLTMPVREFGYGIASFYREAAELRPMCQLVNYLRRRVKGSNDSH